MSLGIPNASKRLLAFGETSCDMSGIDIPLSGERKIEGTLGFGTMISILCLTWKPLYYCLNDYFEAFSVPQTSEFVVHSSPLLFFS